MRKLVTVALVAVAAIGVLSLVRAEDKKTVKQVMKEAHGGGNKSLLFKVAGGKGNKEDAEKLLALYKDLAEGEPKKGDKEKWKEKTEAIVKAAEAVVAGEEGAAAKLQKAANCMNCHKEHK
jgi:hypothetical protein